MLVTQLLMKSKLKLKKYPQVSLIYDIYTIYNC